MAGEFFIWLFGGFVLMLALGIPLAYALLLSSGLAMAVTGELSPELIVQQMVKGIDSFPLLAIPVFFFAGELMNRGKISEYLITLCMVLVGTVRGALAHFAVLVSMIFAGTTGSSAAEAAAMGSVFIPNLIRRGYDRAFSVALVACASVIGIIIPPSVFMIIYGSFGNVSVTALFVAGIVPGCLIGFGLMAIAAWNAHRHHYPREREVRASLPEAWAAVKKGVWPIGAPVVLIGGMVGGLFTPTEASLVTVGYTMILAMMFYRTIRVRDLPAMLGATAAQASIPLFCLACAHVYGYLLGLFKVPELVGNGIWHITDNPRLIMLWVIGLFLAVGTFMDGVPAIIILLPVTRKLAEVAQIHPLHMGAVVCVTIALGLLTPPYGLCTLISCAIGKVEMKDAFKPMLPMFLMMLGVVLLMGMFPEVVLFLPRWLVPDLVPPD